MVALVEQQLPICVGVDVGQLHDNTALAVAEVESRYTGKLRITGEQKPAYMDHAGNWHPEQGIERVMQSHYTIRHITRLPLNTSYPDVAVHLAELLCNPLLVGRMVRVLIDVTGVGRPVYDDLRKEVRLRRAMVIRGEQGTIIMQRHLPKDGNYVTLVPVSFTHGETYNKRTGSLGKAYLVSRLQSLLQSTRVHGPDTPEMKATVNELRVYQIKVDADGKDTYGAMSTGTHDDLATALALACLEDPCNEQVSYSNRVY